MQQSPFIILVLSNSQLMIPRWSESQAKLSRIQSIDFSILSPANILQISTVEVTEGDLYESAKQPVKNGPLDLRLGVGAKTLICGTCGFTLEDCLGHFGHAKLNLPIYHIGYFKHLIVVLKMVCKQCSQVLLPEKILKDYQRKMSNLQSNYINRLSFFKKIFKEASKNLNCPHCLYKNPTLKKIPKICGKIEVRHPTLRGDINEERVRRRIADPIGKKTENLTFELNPMEALKIIGRIPKAQLILVNIGGDTSVNDLIISHLVIPPVNIRPSIMLTNSLSNEDDLTIKIKEIIELNRKMSNGDDLSRVYKQWYLLQSHWSQYINSDSPGLPLQDLKQNYIRSFCTRLKGKQGRFRQNLSGKRSNYTARTVISPDPNVEIDEVVVPSHMAKILTIREIVNKRSLKFLQKCVKEKKVNFIVTKNGEKRMAHCFKDALKLGDQVERHLMDGDMVIFNRQPSLHRISMMGFRVKVSEGKTLRFNECVCTPFNADFDGDEMNIHVPQTLQARSETKHLMGVNNNIITPKSGQPIVALIQDFLTTAYLITSKDIFFTKAQFTEVVSYFGDALQKIDLPQAAILRPVKLWTGKQVITTLLNPNKSTQLIVNLTVKEKNYTHGECMCLKDGWILFLNGELLLGQLGKATLGGNKTGLIYCLLRDNSNKSACSMMHRFSKLSSRWLSNYGMTIGISDVTPSLPLQQANSANIRQAFESYRYDLNQYQLGRLQAKPGMSTEQTLESLLNQTLSKVRETVGNNCISKLDRYNKPLIMTLCGSKGNAVNLSQMIGCVGQQTVGGKRITYGFTERSLPHFGRLILTPQARGFVKNSFFSGLTATQFFFHTMGGREGIIDTAVKTADTGYMQRRLIKLIEDVSVMYDYTVRTCDRRDIIQFRYGDDGLDPMRTEDSHEPINMRFLENCVKSTKEGKYLSPEQIRETCEVGISKIKTEVVGLEEQFFTKILNKLREYFSKKASKLELECRRIHLPNKVDQLYLRNCFSGMTDTQMQAFFSRYSHRLNRCVLQPGQAIGALAAQSIGQPATQMTLKTFHFAGISSMNITQGVPRVNQIINNTQNIATPIITIYLQDGAKHQAIRVKNKVQKLPLGRILHSIEQVYGISECSLNLVINTRVVEQLCISISIQAIKMAVDSSLKSKIKRSEIISSTVLSIVPQTKTNLMFQLKNLRRRLVNVMIGGINSISRALIVEKGEHVIYAEGLGLKRVLAVPGVDTTRTSSNHISEVEQCLGVEAARQAIINQITQTMREHGVNVNPRHINLLAEVMTCKGKIIGFTRNGVDKMKDSTIMLASFEKTTDFLFDAATQGKHDRMRGVSQRIILGQPITLGTGMFDVVQDIRKRRIY